MRSTGAPDGRSWHEAGHAVVADLLGGLVHSVTLEHDDDALEGQVSVEWRGMSEEAVASASACTAFGGPLAELAHGGDSGPHTMQQMSAWAADWREVLRCATVQTLIEVERESLIRSWFETTRALLADPEITERVARVADALDAHGTLDEVLFADATG